MEEKYGIGMGKGAEKPYYKELSENKKTDVLIIGRNCGSFVRSNITVKSIAGIALVYKRG